jgi:hypothetical protein
MVIWEGTTVFIFIMGMLLTFHLRFYFQLGTAPGFEFQPGTLEW